MQRKALSIPAIELNMSAKAFSLSHLRVAFLVTKHVAGVHAKAGARHVRNVPFCLLKIPCRHILATSSASVFICRLVSRLEDEMLRVKSGDCP